MSRTSTHNDSITRLHQAIETIEQLVPQELRRASQQRKKHLERAHETLRLHGRKLGLIVPELSRFYHAEQFLAHARAVTVQLEQMQRETTDVTTKP